MPTVNAVAAAAIGRLRCGCTATPPTATCWHFWPQAPRRGERYSGSPHNSDAAFKGPTGRRLLPGRVGLLSASPTAARRCWRCAQPVAAARGRRRCPNAAAARNVASRRLLEGFSAQASAAPVALANSSVSSSTCRLGTKKKDFHDV